MTIGLSQGKEAGILQQLIGAARRFQLERRLALVLLVAVLASGTATFVALTTDLPIAARPSVIRLLLVADLVLLLAFSALIARRLVIIWAQRKRGQAGSRLHGRLVALFGLV